ncbi:hypothetical protein ACMAUO_07045 [Gluconacetobacter sp. Hr-1-5]|uniref:oxidoreductase n=1 Tax=Gluconacetobacter sp. Hr-1-5 TaxID=3395370 RepID=UPI003B524823
MSWRAEADGSVGQDTLAWYERIALGRPGAIVIEASGIRDIPSGPLLRISDDRFIEGLSRLVRAIRAASDGQTRVFIQIIDFLAIRRRPDPRRYFSDFLVLRDEHRKAMGTGDDTDVRARLAALPPEELREVLSASEWRDLNWGARERVTDIAQAAIRDLPLHLPGLFARAACRAEAAGCDGVELHYAHAYTMASFLSATNTRTDGWGGSLEGRVRLPVDVIRATRQAVGDGFSVGCRMLSDECIEGGTTVEEAIWIATRLGEAGLDFLSLSRGGKFDDAAQPKIGEAAYPYTGPSGYECIPHAISDERGPFGRNIEASRRIRSALRVAGLDLPVVCAGGVHSLDRAERMLRSDVCDIVGSARQFMADPDWLEKIRKGEGGCVRVCTYTNYCEGLDQKHKQVTCRLWDRERLDAPNVRLAADGKRRLECPVVTSGDQAVNDRRP